MRSAALLALLALMASSFGCSTCKNIFDGTYAAEGGRWVREDPCEGRVGSAFREAGYSIGDVAPEPMEEPPQEDQPEEEPLESEEDILF